MGNVRRREVKACHVCGIEWCSLDHVWANRKTCSQECRHALSGLTQMDPQAPYSGHKHRRPLAGPRLSDVAKATGVPFATMRGILGAQAAQRKMTPAFLSAIGRKGGRASMAKRAPEQRRAIARKAAARANHKRWGTPLPEWAL